VPPHPCGPFFLAIFCGANKKAPTIAAGAPEGGTVSHLTGSPYAPDGTELKIADSPSEKSEL
jgi:hypothetical protein